MTELNLNPVPRPEIMVLMGELVGCVSHRVVSELLAEFLAQPEINALVKTYLRRRLIELLDAPRPVPPQLSPPDRS